MSHSLRYTKDDPRTTLVKLLFGSEESLDAQNNDKKPSRKTQVNVDRNEICPIGQNRTSQ